MQQWNQQQQQPVEQNVDPAAGGMLDGIYKAANYYLGAGERPEDLKGSQTASLTLMSPQALACLDKNQRIHLSNKLRI